MCLKYVKRFLFRIARNANKKTYRLLYEANVSIRTYVRRGEETIII